MPEYQTSLLHFHKPGEVILKSKVKINAVETPVALISDSGSYTSHNENL